MALFTETEVLVTDPKGLTHSFQASVQGPDMKANLAAVTPLKQSLDSECTSNAVACDFSIKLRICILHVEASF